MTREEKKKQIEEIILEHWRCRIGHETVAEQILAIDDMVEARKKILRLLNNCIIFGLTQEDVNKVAKLLPTTPKGE